MESSLSPPATEAQSSVSTTARPVHHTSAVAIVVVLLAAGRLLGYARDAGLAAVFGASSATDAFLVASIVPILLSTALVTGSLAPALLLGFTALIQDRQRAWEMVNSFLTIAALALVALSAFLVWGSGPIIGLLAPGFDLGRSALAVRLVFITLPALFFLGLSGLTGALLNALGVYDIPALGTVLVNGAAFAAILVLATPLGIEGVAFGMVIGALLQFALQYRALRRNGWTYRPSVRWGLRETEVLHLFVPLLAFMVLDQCVTVVERVLSSSFAAGQLSHLAFAAKIEQIPGVILTTSVATVLFPALSQQAVLADFDAFCRLLGSGLRQVLLLTLFPMLWMLLASPTWVALIFRHGLFTAADAEATASLLRWYSLAIVPTGILMVLTRGFQAAKEMAMPLYIGLFGALVYIIGAIGLTSRVGLVGLPLAFILLQIIGAALSWRFLGRRLTLGRLLDRRLGGVSAAGLIILPLVIGWSIWIEPRFLTWGALMQAATFGLALLVTGMLYIAGAWLFRVPEVVTIVSGIRAQPQTSRLAAALLRTKRERQA